MREQEKEREECIYEEENPVTVTDLENATSRRAVGSTQEFCLSNNDQAINLTSRNKYREDAKEMYVPPPPHSYPVFWGGGKECAGEKLGRHREKEVQTMH